MCISPSLKLCYCEYLHYSKLFIMNMTVLMLSTICNTYIALPVIMMVFHTGIIYIYIYIYSRNITSWWTMQNIIIW